MAEITYHVPDISCSGCVRGITKAVSALQGVESVDGDADTKKVRVAFREKEVSEEAIRSAMEKAGFRPS